MTASVLKVLVILLVFTVSGICAAQEEPADASETAALPVGYGSDIKLGMTFAETQTVLVENPAYGYKGEADVSLIESPNRTLIETAGLRDSVFERCWFHFYEDKLYIITLALNPAKADHYSIFTTLRGKYGDPKSLSPEKTVWENETVLMSLERPLTLRYVDAPVFQQLLNAAAVEKSGAEYLRDRFLEGL
ncbi:MAG: hypothetical protein LBS97_00845 [Treponema sp.]|jgi:hypothetical protein|nr:hypothetical protein [Treponema sp.]